MTPQQFSTAGYRQRSHDYSLGARMMRAFLLFVGAFWLFLIASFLISFRDELGAWIAFMIFGLIVSSIFIVTCLLLVRRQQRIGADDRGISAKILGIKLKKIAWQEIEWIEVVEEFNPLPRHRGRGRQKRIFVMGAGRAIAFTDRIRDAEELYARCLAARARQPVPIVERVWNEPIGLANGMRRALVLYRRYPGASGPIARA